MHVDELDFNTPPTVEEWTPELPDAPESTRPTVPGAPVPRPVRAEPAPVRTKTRGKVIGGAVLTALIISLAAAQAVGGVAVVMAGAGVGGAAALGGAVYGIRKLRRRIGHGRAGRIRPGRILGRGPGLGLGGGRGGGLIPKLGGKTGRSPTPGRTGGRGGLLGRMGLPSIGSTLRRGTPPRARGRTPAGFGSTPRAGGRSLFPGRKPANSGTTGGTRFAPRRATAVVARTTAPALRRVGTTMRALRRAGTALAKSTGITGAWRRRSDRRDQIRQRREARRDTKWKARYRRRDRRRYAWAKWWVTRRRVGRRLRRDLWAWLGSVVRALLTEPVVAEAAAADPVEETAPGPKVVDASKPSPRPRTTPRPRPPVATFVRTVLPAAPDVHDDEVDTDVTLQHASHRPRHAAPERPTRGGAMHPAHERALEAYREAIGGWEPASLPDTDAFLASFAELYRGMAEVNGGLGDRLDSETPVDRSVADYLRDTGGGLNNMGDGGEELHGIWRSANAADIARHEDGRPNEAVFDVSRA